MPLLSDLLILLAIVGLGALLSWPRVANAPLWRATVTPLASIIGSGFLILGPILDASYGRWAPAVMAGLCLTAIAFGAAIRYNIAHIDRHATRSRAEDAGEVIASTLLAFAYIISVAYYLNLFGAFGVDLTPFGGPLAAKVLTTAVYALILGVGWTHGFRALERLEQVSVGVKLAIILGLLVGLTVFFAERAGQGALVANPATVQGWAAVTLAFGLIVTVQGFETSRYLGATYDAETRIASMRWAQRLSTAIYLVYILLMGYVFRADQLEISETAIIDLMKVVSPVLPVLLVVAALSAQFSAAVADTSGSGGLMREVTGGWIRPKVAYAILVGLGVAMTWTLDVFQIVAYASRAFSAYYAVQAALAAVAAGRDGARGRLVFFAGLALLGAAITVFGRAVEG